MLQEPTHQVAETFSKRTEVWTPTEVPNKVGASFSAEICSCSICKMFEDNAGDVCGEISSARNENERVSTKSELRFLEEVETSKELAS